MRIITWNINSLRIRLQLLKRVCETLNPDIVCLQETKVPDDLFPIADIEDIGFTHIFFSGMKSYNGVAILSKIPLEAAQTKTWCGREDCRHISAILPTGLELHNFYVPAGGDIPDPAENKKFAHKLDFLKEMAAWFAQMDQGYKILVGDLNIAPLETDVWSHKQLLNVVSHTPVEVEGLDKVMRAHDWIDTTRLFVPKTETLFSWWSYRNRTWPGSNRGRRLDHIWASRGLEGHLLGAHVFQEPRGWEKPSDHVPVVLDLDF
jgi:exodeoxyribonuclease-3